MDISSHALWSLIHGMGFGGLYLLACSGAIVELWRRFAPSSPAPVTARDERFIRIYFALMAALAWLAVLTGAYMIYPWYRATPPAGATSLGGFPQRLLLSNPSTAAWLPWNGMEGARCLAGAYLYHHGVCCAHALWPRPDRPS